MIKIFIGYDRHERVAYSVAAHSILKRASQPVSIIPLYKHNLIDKMWRQRHALQSTDFSFSRFLTPYLSDFEGISIFMDCDVVCMADIYELLKLAQSNQKKAIWCVKHDYTPKTERKFLNQHQSVYQKKNWSSVMVFRNSLCTRLTPSYVNIASGLDLHQFRWLEDDNLIGELPKEWNWLIGEYEKNDNAKLYHYTLGTPCFPDYKECNHSKIWWDEYLDMISYSKDKK